MDSQSRVAPLVVRGADNVSMSTHFLTDAEARVWCSNLGVNPDIAQFPMASRFELPSDAGKLVALARHVWRTLIPSGGEVLVWTRDRHVFESCEHTPAVNRWMEAFGDTRGIDLAPALLATAASEDDGLSLVLFAVLFVWDCWVIRSASEFVMFSHDEWFAVGPGCSGLLSDVQRFWADSKG